MRGKNSERDFGHAAEAGGPPPAPPPEEIASRRVDTTADLAEVMADTCLGVLAGTVPLASAREVGRLGNAAGKLVEVGYRYGLDDGHGRRGVPLRRERRDD